MNFKSIFAAVAASAIIATPALAVPGSVSTSSTGSTSLSGCIIDPVMLQDALTITFTISDLDLEEVEAGSTLLFDFAWQTDFGHPNCFDELENVSMTITPDFSAAPTLDYSAIASSYIGVGVGNVSNWVLNGLPVTVPAGVSDLQFTDTISFTIELGADYDFTTGGNINDGTITK